jgi:DNA-binding CsgD family transcriptional regulator
MGRDARNDDIADLELRLGRSLGRYGELYPDMAKRLASILRSSEPTIHGRVQTLARLVAKRSDDLRDLLAERFDLTPAEARVAIHLVEGGDIASYALAAGVSPGTVRTHLKAIFAKTGVNRQAALVKLARQRF